MYRVTLIHQYTDRLYKRLHTYFYWRFLAPPVLEASRNRPISQAVPYELSVENISIDDSLR